MASGSEPLHIQRLFTHLRPITVGLSLCGAGAGGFAVVLLKKNKTKNDLQKLLNEFLVKAPDYQIVWNNINLEDDEEENGKEDSKNVQPTSDVDFTLTLHTVNIDSEGLATSDYNNDFKQPLSDYLFKI